jgi:hypothetical protein
MRKYAAATALVMALTITMLTPAVSAHYLCPGGNGRCTCQCRNDWDHDYNVAPAGSLLALEKKLQACLSKCVNAFEAARRQFAPTNK